MKINQAAVAGTLESSDVLVKVTPAAQGLTIELESAVYDQFGDSILATVREVLAALAVENAHIALNDRGALDCVIRARLETALKRAEGGN